jgi:undecaprenyl-diphosphatase
MNAIILLILCQIVLESFPVSSSGHMLLLEKLSDKFGVPLPNLSESFDYFLHGPTILILMVLFFKDWAGPVKRLLFSYPSRRSCLQPSLLRANGKTKTVRGEEASQRLSRTMNDSHKKLFRIFLKICGYVVITTIIAVFFHVIIKGFLSKQGWFDSNLSLLIGFCITAGLLALLLYKDSKTDPYEKLNLKKVLIIGFVQGLALLPGISRFASVYTTTRLLNLSPRRAFQFTFLIQFPLIVAGFLLGCFKLVKTPNWTNLFSLQINLTFVFATVAAFLGLYWMQKLALNKKIGRVCFYMFIPILMLVFLMLK